MTSLGAVGWPGYADRQDRAKIGFVFFGFDSGKPW